MRRIARPGSFKFGFALKVFNVNASYARTYNFKEEASSRIKINLSARPKES